MHTESKQNQQNKRIYWFFPKQHFLLKMHLLLFLMKTKNQKTVFTYIPWFRCNFPKIHLNPKCLCYGNIELGHKFFPWKPMSFAAALFYLWLIHSFLLLNLARTVSFTTRFYSEFFAITSCVCVTMTSSEKQWFPVISTTNQLLTNKPRTIRWYNVITRIIRLSKYPCTVCCYCLVLKRCVSVYVCTCTLFACSIMYLRILQDMNDVIT